MNTATVTARPAAHAGGRGNTLLRAAQIVLAAVFAFAAVPKLTGAHTAVTMFGQIGAGQWLRYLVGSAELAGRRPAHPAAGRARRGRAGRRHGRRIHHQRSSAAQRRYRDDRSAVRRVHPHCRMQARAHQGPGRSHHAPLTGTDPPPAFCHADQDRRQPWPSSSSL